MKVYISLNLLQIFLKIGYQALYEEVYDTVSHSI